MARFFPASTVEISGDVYCGYGIPFTIPLSGRCFYGCSSQEGDYGGNLGGAPLFRPATTSALAIVQATLTNLPLVVDILSPSVAASIATPVASSADARGFPVGGVVLEGIPPPSFSLQFGEQGWVACYQQDQVRHGRRVLH